MRIPHPLFTNLQPSGLSEETNSLLNYSQVSHDDALERFFLLQCNLHSLHIPYQDNLLMDYSILSNWIRSWSGELIVRRSRKFWGPKPRSKDRFGNDCQFVIARLFTIPDRLEFQLILRYFAVQQAGCLSHCPLLPSSNPISLPRHARSNTRSTDQMGYDKSMKRL